MPELSVQPLQNPGTVSSVGTINSQQPISTSPPSSPTQNIVHPNTGEALDPKAVSLARAIRKTESNGNYDASNKDVNGWSVGAYQWHGNDEQSARLHFVKDATSHGLDSNDFSPKNQDLVAYSKIKALKDKGYHADEIAALWNGAKMVDGRPVAINPHYVDKVAGNVSQDQETYNPKPFSNPNPGLIDTTGHTSLNEKNNLDKHNDDPFDKSGTKDYNRPSTGLYDTVKNYDIGALKSLGQAGTGLLKLGGKIGNAFQGKGFQVQEDPNSFIGKADQFLAPSNRMQKMGNVAGNIGQFFIPGGQEIGAEKVLSKFPSLVENSPKIAKAMELGTKGLIGGAKDFTTAQAQGDSSTDSAVIGGLGASMPFASELLGKGLPVLKNFLGGEGTADALKVKKATPKLVEAWQNGTRGANDLADNITQSAKNYEQQGKTAFNAMKQSLPDINMPQNFVEGGIKKSLQDLTEGASNLNGSEERTISNLQKFVDKAKINGVKGLLDLRQNLDNAGFYRAGDAEYNNSNRIVQQFRKSLNDAAVYQAENFDKGNGTNYAEQIKNGLADAADRINFMDKFKKNLLGTNPETYVERTSNKVKSLINKFGDPSDAENTKSLLEEFEQRMGQPGIFSKDFQAANAAKNLKGLKGRMLVKGAKYTAGASILTGGGLLGDLLSHTINNPKP